MRSCNGCTKCCEGWLQGEAHGHAFWAGHKCHFCNVNEGCAIYEKRPEDPCKSFRCAWLVDANIPEWMKPSKCGVIIVFRKIEEHEFFEIVETGTKLDSEILSWFIIQYANGNVKNLVWQCNGGKNWIGTNEFLEKFNESQK